MANIRIEDEILKRGLISQEGYRKALEISAAMMKPVVNVMIDNGLVQEEGILGLMAESQGLDLIRISELSIDKRAIKSVPAKLAAHYGVLPVSLAGSTLTIAVSNAMDMSAVDDIQTNLGYHVERVLARKREIGEALRMHYGVGADTVERILSESGDRAEIVAHEESHDLERIAEDASVVKLVNQIMQEAINDRATDIHFEAYRDSISLRRRIDGVMYETNVQKNTRMLYPAIISRIKLMSGLDIVEKRLPQDGRARVRIGAKEYDLRISVVPAIHGEDVVIRILPSEMLFDLPHLGFSGSNLQMLQDLVDKPHGIIFVTGPTGSGKSTTLYACLSKLNTRDVKIITIEDPVEYELKGITQTQINPKIGLTFSRALRSMLRHDPDIMMVGEVRDRETAEIAIQTAMTGHLVLSTLHTNDAAGGAVRLIDMGIDPYLITSTVLSFIAQRLVRTICVTCRESYTKDGQTLYRGRGCRECNNSGFLGRVAISEFMPLVPEIQQMIIRKESAKAIRDKADSLGMITLAQDGKNKIHEGITTVEEVLRVTTM